MRASAAPLRLALRAALLALACWAGPAAAGVVVVGHATLGKVDGATVQKIFLGKVIEVAGVGVTAVNAQAGSTLRERFLRTYLEQDEEKYTSYWTVRRYIGKGAPPRELAGAAEVIQFVQGTPGAIGYVDEAELRPGVHVLLRK